MCRRLAPDCRQCWQPGAEHLRQRWGCDDIAPVTIVRTTCPRCMGACQDPGGEPPATHIGLQKSPAAGAPPGSCLLCRGGGAVEYRRCPTAILGGGDNEWIPRFRLAMVDLSELGDWPVPGGPSAQSAWFYSASHIWMSERATIRRELEKAAAKPGLSGSTS